MRPEPLEVRQPRLHWVQTTWPTSPQALPLIVLALVALALTGCKSEHEAQLEAELRRVSERVDDPMDQVDTSERERIALQRQVMDLTAENAELAKQVVLHVEAARVLRDDVAQLRPETLKAADINSGAATAPEVSIENPPSEVLPEVRIPYSDKDPDTPPQTGQPIRWIGETTQAIAAFETRRTNLRARIAAGQSKVSALARATLDVRTRTPYGKTYVEGVREGDFRTQHDKDVAIQAAKEELLPLYEEMRFLEAELEPLKKLLAEMLREQAQETRASPPPQDPVGGPTVLKHKQTGETIKGILTQAKVNNLRVFKLADGGTRFINPGEWEAIDLPVPDSETPR